MKRILSKISKIWFPALLVGIVALQGFSADWSRAVEAGFPWTGNWSENSTLQDTVIYHNDIYTKFRSEYERAMADSAAADTLGLDSADVFILPGIR